MHVHANERCRRKEERSKQGHTNNKAKQYNTHVHNTIQDTPTCTLTLSASISAPASMTNSWLSSSFTTAAVSPAAVLALPDVYTALGLNSSTCLVNLLVTEGLKLGINHTQLHRSTDIGLTHLRNWLLAVLGSPTMHTLISPRRRVPSIVIFGTPPNSINRTPRFTSSLPERGRKLILKAKWSYC